MMTLRVLTFLLLSVMYALPATATEVDARGSVRGDGRYHSEENAVVIDGRIDFEVDIGPFSFGGAYRAYDFGEGDYNPRGIDRVYDIWHRYVEGRAGGLGCGRQAALSNVLFLKRFPARGEPGIVSRLQRCKE